MDRPSNDEEVSHRPVEKTSDLDHGLNPGQDWFGHQLNAMERNAQAAVDLLRTQRLVTIVGEYEVRTTLTIGRVWRYRCRVQRKGTARAHGFWPSMVGQTRQLGTGTVMPDTRRVALALDAVEAHFTKCATMRARAAQPRQRTSRPTRVIVAMLLLTAALTACATRTSPVASSMSMTLGLLLAVVGSFLGFACLHHSPRAKKTLILFGHELRLRELTLVVCLVGCLLAGLPILRFAVMHQPETPAGGLISQDNAELPTGEGQSVAPQQHGTPETREGQRLQSPEPFPLTGKWTITNTVVETSYRPYQSLQLGFHLVIHQQGDRFTGEGAKESENGQRISGSARRPIRVTGTIVNGAVIDATFQEESRSRLIQGRFTLTARNRNHLRGTFVATAAGARGVSQWIRAD
jgi:hypothetical protein